MKVNLANAERLIRAFVVAPAAIVLAFVLGPGSVAGVVLFAVAAIMLATAALSSCPLWALLRINTRTGTAS